MVETEVYESGYEANFETPPPEYLQCAVCTLVLRDPVLMVDCGHRFCKGCYEKMKDYAKSINVSLLCPHDREEIERQCAVHLIPASLHGLFFPHEFQVLNSFVQCKPKEGKVVEDKGIARVILDLKVKCDKFGEGCNWSGELRDLMSHKNGNCQRVDPLSLLSKFTRRLEQCEIRLNEKDIVIEKLEAEVQLQKTNFQGYKGSTKEEIKMLNKRLELCEQISTAKECEIQKLIELLGRSNTELEEIKKMINHMEKEQDGAENSSRRASSYQSLAYANFQNDPNQSPNLTQKSGPDLNTPDDISKKIKELQERIMNVSEYIPHHKTVFDWTLYNYDEFEYEGETVYSPIFYSHWNHGHSCKLELNWHGRQNGRLSIALVVCKGIYGETPRGRFQMAYTFEVENEFGERKTSLISKREVRENFRRFYIQPDETESEGYGDEYFLTMPALTDYVMTNSLKIKCTLWKHTPSQYL